MSRLSEAVWSDILAFLRQNHRELVHPGFSRLESNDFDGGVLRVWVGDAELHRHLEQKCKGAFTQAAQRVTGYLVSVEFCLSADLTPRAAERPGPLLADSGVRLNPDYIFDNFVTGPENRMAHAACRAVAEAPGKTYNPLFIHGGSGLGKTHLLQAIGHELLATNPRARMAYLSCETFVNHFIEAVERGDLYEFRHRYRDADMLVLDDIQFLTERERSQDEFFHTFNTLYQSQRQIVLSADCAPAEIPELAERLVSRFQWGLVARIDPFCVETRIAILRTKSRVRAISAPEEVLDFIGTTIRGNARELEGALLHVKAYAEMIGSPITMENARHAMAGEVAPPRTAEISLSRIMSAVTEHFQVKLSDLRGPRRHRSIVLARQACMYLARQMTAHSLEEIGAYFGGRDHSTVLHSQRTFAERCKQDAKLRDMIGTVEQHLRQG